MRAIRRVKRAAGITASHEPFPSGPKQNRLEEKLLIEWEPSQAQQAYQLSLIVRQIIKRLCLLIAFALRSNLIYLPNYTNAN